MPNSRVNRNDQNSSFLFPTTKLTNISCAFCRHQFFLRELLHLRPTFFPLLLRCGHAACHKCVKIYAGDSCPLCNTLTEYEIVQDNCLLPVNIYVTGLLTVMTANVPRDDDPDVSFSQSLSTRMKERSMEGSLCSECGMQAAIKCLQCNELFCHTCVEKVHARMETSQQHFRVLLTNSSEDTIFDTKRCGIHNQFHGWYCNDCEISVCSECMLRFHPKHQGVPLTDKNNEYMDDFVKAYKKLSETLHEVRQTQKMVIDTRIYSE